MGQARGGDWGRGDAAARGQPLFSALPPCAVHRSSSPAARGAHAPQAGSMAPAAARMALPPGRRVRSHGDMAPEQPGTGGFGRAGDVQPSQGTGQASRPPAGISPTPGLASLGVPCPSLASPAPGAPLAAAAIPSSSARQPEGFCSGRAARAGDAAEQGWEGEGCGRRWWHSGTAGRCHSNTSCALGPAGIGEGCEGDSIWHRPGSGIPVPARCSGRPRKQQRLERVGMKGALSRTLFSPHTGPRQCQQ